MFFQSNPRRKHNAKMMEVILDEDEDQCGALEANVHEQWDQDTTLKQLEIHQTERPLAQSDNHFNINCQCSDRPPSSRPECVFMDNDTWKKIISEDRRSWLHISEHGKLAIIEHGFVCKDGFQSGGPGSKPQGGAPLSRRTASVHDLEFEDTPGSHNGSDTPPIEAKTHERQGSVMKSTSDFDTKKPSVSFDTRQMDSIQGLLHMATHTSDASNGNIAQVLYQQTRSNCAVCAYEIMQRSEYSPHECGTHEMHNYLEDEDGETFASKDNVSAGNIVYEVNAHRYLRRTDRNPDSDEDVSPTPTVPTIAPP